MESSLDLTKFWCWQNDCIDYGKKGAGNIVLKERYGKDNRALLKCRTCGHCFSETHGTPFFGLNTTIDEVCRTLAMIPEKGSIRGAARMSGHDKSTICKWVDLSGQHCKEVTDYFLKELRLDRVQVDEIWSYIKKGEKRRCQRFERIR
jgi:transposase-like protein